VLFTSVWSAAQRKIWEFASGQGIVLFHVGLVYCAAKNFGICVCRAAKNLGICIKLSKELRFLHRFGPPHSENFGNSYRVIKGIVLFFTSVWSAAQRKI
jgi:hypothetical protein